MIKRSANWLLGLACLKDGSSSRMESSQFAATVAPFRLLPTFRGVCAVLLAFHSFQWRVHRSARAQKDSGSNGGGA